MKKLTNILPQGYYQSIFGDSDIWVSGLELDSRKVQEGNLFAALQGSELDGSQYIADAIAKGAKSVICSKLPEKHFEGVTYIVTDSPSKLMALVAGNFYEKPSEKFDLVGVTGTNGKTTVSTLLYNLFRKLGYKCGLVATTGIIIEDKKLDTQHTTPDAITLNRIMAEMAEADCDFVFMEVSSHAVVQDRIFGLNFKGGVFTNLTHDHLDYHKTFDAYRDAKKHFFDTLDMEAFALTNADDKNGKYMLQNTKAAKVTYALENPSDFKGKILEFDLHGMRLQLDDEEIYTHLSGKFNAYNLLAAYGVAIMMDVPKADLLLHLSALHSAEGRFNTIQLNGITGIVDYAHTPDALENILDAIHEINVQGKRIITVVGCGGNRDKTKRPIMAKIASDLSSQVILTSDNPRNEEPEEILKEMEAGIPYGRRGEVLTITDRRQAIKTACKLAQKGDIILIAGKGHEKYQEIKGVRYDFDDKQVLTEILTETATR